MAYGERRVMVRRRGPRTGVNLWSLAYDLVRRARNDGGSVANWTRRVRTLESGPRRQLKRPHPKTGGAGRTWKRSRYSGPSRGLKYFTNGYGIPRFNRKRKPVKGTKYETRGVIVRVEEGGVHADADCVYLGHASNVDYFFRCFCQLLMKQLAVKLGLTVTSMSRKWTRDDQTAVVSPGSLLYTFRVEQNGTLRSQTLNVAADATLAETADAFKTNLLTVVIPAFSDVNHFELLSIHFAPNDNGGSSDLVFPRLDMRDYLISFKCESMLTLQNRTVASSAVGNDETSRDDVANNPLSGRVYRGSGNAISYKYDNATTAKLETCPAFDSGIIFVDYSNLPADSVLQYKRPPAATAFNRVKSSAGVFLNPGQLKKDNWFHEKTMYLSTFFQMIMPYIIEVGRGTASETYLNLGKFSVFAFEKKCNTQVDEPSISVGYELNQVYKMCFKKRNMVTVPLNYVL